MAHGNVRRGITFMDDTQKRILLVCQTVSPMLCMSQQYSYHTYAALVSLVVVNKGYQQSSRCLDCRRGRLGPGSGSGRWHNGWTSAALCWPCIEPDRRPWRYEVHAGPTCMSPGTKLMAGSAWTYFASSDADNPNNAFSHAEPHGTCNRHVQRIHHFTLFVLEENC